ncbi:MAG TPA: acyltransferase [Blastocatellia bacterium]|nr:acyltransferase [Blastocatellia bacterium]HMV83202.1 acyltransferase [Blastocatellia bacterium]HMX26434.1 acyltransferase [Blastocatellia bacterium]HMY73771.1 acyltransferase [Blastocatellia bacterium]HMZ21065.1 acyltransferase [Blastocatellia bacterium]
MEYFQDCSSPRTRRLNLPAFVRSCYEWVAKSLSRVTSTGDLIPEVDGLRFIAISVVVFHHLVSIYLPVSGRMAQMQTYADWMAASDQSWLIRLAYCGHFGVQLFFVISGFILALPFAKRAFNSLPAPDLKGYYLRRVTRIEPPYVICLLLLFFLFRLDGGDMATRLPNLLASLIYSHGLIFGRESLINGVTWSLEIEIQFYLLVPFLVSIFRWRNAALRRATLLAAILGGSFLSLNVIYPSGSSRLPLTFLNFSQYFLTGFLLADLYLSYAGRERKKTFAWDAVTVAAAAMMTATLIRFGMLYCLLPLMIGVFYVGCYLGRLSNAFVRLRWIVILGGMCYTIYLYHVTIIGQAFVYTGKWTSSARPFSADFLLHAALILPVLLALCAWLFIVGEKPFMRWSLSSRRTLPDVEPLGARDARAPRELI